jgi:dual specificity phosphatase 3
MTLPGFEWANACRVTERIWVGGDLEITDPGMACVQLDELDAAGLTDIVDLRLEWNDEVWVTRHKPHLRYRWLGVDDAGPRMPDEWFDVGTHHVLGRLEAGATVLVHCHMGVNRAPSMGYAALLALGWDPVEALDAIRSARPIAFVGYAEDALDWWLRKNGATRSERTAGQHRIRQWRRDNHLNVASVIRKIRLREGA